MADFILSPVIRGQRLEESLEYQQFVANVEEEEAWINEKMTLVASEDYGDTLAAIQVRETGGAACCFPPPPPPPSSCLPHPFPASLLGGRALPRRALRAGSRRLVGGSRSSRSHARDAAPL